MATARIDKEGWCRCGRCGHKLARIVGKFPQGQHKMPAMEIKCHSCKQISYIMIGAVTGTEERNTGENYEN